MAQDASDDRLLGDGGNDAQRAAVAIRACRPVSQRRHGHASGDCDGNALYHSRNRYIIVGIGIANLYFFRHSGMINSVMPSALSDHYGPA